MLLGCNPSLLKKGNAPTRDLSCQCKKVSMWSGISGAMCAGWEVSKTGPSHDAMWEDEETFPRVAFQQVKEMGKVSFEQFRVLATDVISTDTNHKLGCYGMIFQKAGVFYGLLTHSSSRKAQSFCELFLNIPDDGLTNKRHHQGRGVQGWSLVVVVTQTWEKVSPQTQGKEGLQSIWSQPLSTFTSFNGCLYPGWEPLGLLQEKVQPHDYC